MPLTPNQSCRHRSSIPVRGLKSHKKSGTSLLFVKSPPAAKLWDVKRPAIPANISCTALKTRDTGQAGVYSPLPTKCKGPASSSKGSRHPTGISVSDKSCRYYGFDTVLCPGDELHRRDIQDRFRDQKLAWNAVEPCRKKKFYAMPSHGGNRGSSPPRERQGSCSTGAPRWILTSPCYLLVSGTH
jgi:hypothetical protein